MKWITLVLLLMLSIQNQCFGYSEKDWNSNWIPCNPSDEKLAADFVKRFKSNYDGPSFSSFTKVSTLAEFSCGIDGNIKWIYHPSRFQNEQILSKKTKDKVDDAIRKSGKIPGTPWRGLRCFVLIYSPSNQGEIRLCGCDHPCQFRAYVTKRKLARWAREKFFTKNTDAIKKNVVLPGKEKTDATAACWICLNPDSSIEMMVPLPVVTGKAINKSDSKIAESALVSAIKKSKLSYEGAPALPNQPIGLIFLFRPDGSINAMPYLNDFPPFDLVWTKGETKICECSD